MLCATDAVVGDEQPESVLFEVRADADVRRVAVLRRVRDGFRGDEVGGRLYRRGKPGNRVDVDFERDDGTPGEFPECGSEAATRERPRVDAAGQAPQLIDRLTEFGARDVEGVLRLGR